MDDNKTLCLANSERIKLPTTLHMMFEVQDLKVASPATVSRCGMVYMEQVSRARGTRYCCAALDFVALPFGLGFCFVAVFCLSEQPRNGTSCNATKRNNTWYVS